MSRSWTRIGGLLVATVLLVVGLVVVGFGSGFVSLDDIRGLEDVSSAEPGQTFEEVGNAVGIDYESAEPPTDPMGVMSNSGAYVADIDNSGEQDVLLIGGDRPRLYENRNGTFSESDTLPQLDPDTRTALFFDHDNDGWDDLVVFPDYGTPQFYENVGGEFEPRDVGLDVELQIPIGATVADADGDGCLDLVVIQTGDWFERLPAGVGNYSIEPDEDNGNPNYFFEGSCGTFEERTDLVGIHGDRWTLATSFTDLTGNGFPDLHMANDFNYDIVYENRGDGTFEQHVLGSATNRNAMSSAATDLTNDGQIELFVTNIFFPGAVDRTLNPNVGVRTQGNNLLVANFDADESVPVLKDQASKFGVADGGWGWAAVVGDFDNSGTPAILHSTSSVQFLRPNPEAEEEVEWILEQFPYFRYPALFEPAGDGSFSSVNASEHGFVPMDGRGLVSFDFTSNGALDVLVATADGPYRVYENQRTANSSLRVDVEPGPDLPAEDARVTVGSGDEVQSEVYTVGSDFLSQDDRILHFGLGEASEVDVTVTWADGTTVTIEAVSTGGDLTVAPDGTFEFEPRD